MYKKTNSNKIKDRIFGFIPARMAATRFPNKPLKKILGIPMIEHVYERSKLFKNWKNLFLTTCDKEIKSFCSTKNIPVIMTSKKHKRCLDRVYEAASKIKGIKDRDIVVCVQGDEPMMKTEMIENVLKPIYKNKKINATVLAMDIIDERQFRDINAVKIIHKISGEVLYTSRAPIPHTKNFTKKTKAKRIYGIFAFRWHSLKKFYFTKPSFLEISESCDSNRICDNHGGQFIAKQKYEDSFSVDTEKDLKKVEKYLKKNKQNYKYLTK
jgi:3-deoxy-manno-octulosonate cytidylyltransferase (CMP-KDO synthetase)